MLPTRHVRAAGSEAARAAGAGAATDWTTGAGALTADLVEGELDTSVLPTRQVRASNLASEAAGRVTGAAGA